MWPVLLAPAAQRGEMPDQRTCRCCEEEQIQTALSQLPWPKMKPGYEDVRSERQSQQRQNGENQAGIFLLVIRVSSTSQTIFILTCHTTPELKNKNARAVSAPSAINKTRTGFMRKRPFLDTGLSGSPARRASIARGSSSRSASQDSTIRSRIRRVSLSGFISEHHRGSHLVIKEDLHDHGRSQSLANDNNSLRASSWDNILRLAFGMGHGQPGLPRRSQLIYRALVELSAHQSGDSRCHLGRFERHRKGRRNVVRPLRFVLDNVTHVHAALRPEDLLDAHIHLVFLRAIRSRDFFTVKKYARQHHVGQFIRGRARQRLWWSGRCQAVNGEVHVLYLLGSLKLIRKTARRSPDKEITRRA